MNTSKHLILKDGIDITNDVKHCIYNPDTYKYDITFQNGKTYPYNFLSIEWLKDPEALNPTLVHIFHDGRELFNIIKILVFKARFTDYWHISFSNESKRSYDKRDLHIVTSCLNDAEASNCLSYLRQLAEISELKNENGEILLHKQYENLAFVGSDTVMAVYLNPNNYKAKIDSKQYIYYPFGGNASQFKAVKNALCNKISVIQGPPGTGKTQTILNIIANLLIEGNTMQVVSSNNSATENVLEKLSSPKYNLGFLVAPLGNTINKKAFVNSQTGCYPVISSWKMDAEKQNEVKLKIKFIADEMSSIFIKQERLAQAKHEYNSLLLEIKYFEQYCNETNTEYTDIKPRRNLNSKILMQLWQECYGFSEHGRALTFWFKLRSVFLYGISKWGFYKNSLPKIITLIQNKFYNTKKEELNTEISVLEKTLSFINVKGKMDELIELSMNFLRAKLYERYSKNTKRIMFTEEDLWKRPEEVVREYPIVLSTTFSSRSCLRGITYDYLIMDEASQVDITTGALAMSCAKNAVIVGDLKQLPNVVTDDIKKRSDAIFNSYRLQPSYSFSMNSFLKSICGILPDVPQTLLREHYRCHPKIIGFCNQKFYNNELIIMTEDNEKPDTLSVIKTVQGNHQRGRINQRQIDVTIKEALPMCNDIKPEDIGIIAPYKDQVTAISGQLNRNGIEVHTVHKFQGREKDTIILTTVDNQVTDFSDNPYLLNVAVSRAKSRLCLVVSGNEQPSDSNIRDLISYIEYNNFQVMESKLYSVFDFLYREYTEARVEYLKKHFRISTYDSENLMYGSIVDILNSRPQLTLSVICHQPLNMLIRDPKFLNDDECQFVMNTATHIDFLIFNRINKKPVLAIEVDGFHFHMSGTKQYERDRMKEHILHLYEIPLLRFATNGSEEVAQISQALDSYK